MDNIIKLREIMATLKQPDINSLNIRYNINDDIRIHNIEPVLPPIAVLEKYPMSKKVEKVVLNTREHIYNVLNHEDDRLVVVIGPCSIHDVDAAVEYAKLLQVQREKHAPDLEIVMRVYFEKPRTTVGWKGLINDPNLDGTYNINDGLRIARKLLVDINQLGMPVATEFLDMISPQYIGDLVSWGAIGARTTESQTHRELVSGLSAPIGFKNATNGSIQVAIDAILAARIGHYFLSVTKLGHAAIVSTIGNHDCHIILRGGNKEPNYEKKYVDETKQALKEAGLTESIMIDFSHANSRKKHQNQLLVNDDVSAQISAGEHAIVGVMVESNLVEGAQKLGSDPSTLEYGKSITDECIGWQDTEKLLEKLAAAVRERRKHKK